MGQFVSDDAVVGYIGEINDREDPDEGLVPHRVRSFRKFERVMFPMANPYPGDLEESFSESLAKTYAADCAETAPPVVIDGEDHSLIDGFHRMQAARRRGETHVLAFVGREPRPEWEPYVDPDDVIVSRISKRVRPR